MRAARAAAQLLLATAVASLAACRVVEDVRFEPVAHYDAWLESPGGPLRFGLELGPKSAPSAVLVNGSERIEVPKVEVRGDVWYLSMPHYDSSLDLRYDNGRLIGKWTKVRGADRVTRMDFEAVPARTPRATSPAAAVVGRWRVSFGDSDAPAVGVFEAAPDGGVQGTFLTELGDYRFLDGAFHDGVLELSCFDGAHAFLFRAELDEDGRLSGDFWSRDSWHETWTAERDDAAGLSDPFELSAWTAAVDLGALAFPDLDGTPRTLDDAAFAGRARVIQLFGSWCPNCHDEAPYLVELDERYRARGLSILGLAFELTGDLQRDSGQVRRYVERYGVEYPILVAGTADKADASRRFPLLDRVRAYPTTIFLDAAGNARAVHTGFAGPATGAEHEHLRAEFERLIEQLLAEAEESGS